MSQPLRWSALRHLARSPRHYRWELEHPSPSTPAMRIGSAVHCAVLRPDAFASDYIVAPDGIDRRSKAGREWYEEHAHVEVLSRADAEQVRAMADAVHEHPVAREWLAQAVEVERARAWSIDGRACTGTPDAITPAAVIDLKTARDLERFDAVIWRYLYHGQLAWYADAVGLDDGRIIAVESRPPHDVACLVLSADLLDEGRALYRRLLEVLAECERSGVWPGARPEPIEVRAPAWATADDDDLSDLDFGEVTTNE